MHRREARQRQYVCFIIVIVLKSDRKKCKVRARIHNFAHMNNAAITTRVAFTGHRTYNHEANRLLRHTVLSLHSAGKHTFLSGMAAGFDMAAAEAVLDCRTARTDIRLVAVIRFADKKSVFQAMTAFVTNKSSLKPMKRSYSPNTTLGAYMPSATII